MPSIIEVELTLEFPPRPQYSADTRRLLEQADWQFIGATLVAHIVGRLRFRRRPYDSVIDATDIAQEAISRVLAGHRPWDPTRGDLVSHLFFTARSIISNLSSRPRLITTADPSWINEVPDDSGDNPERNYDLRERLQYILSLEADDEELAQIVRRVALGESPSEIAAAVNLDIREVYSRLRNFRRRVASAARAPGRSL